MKPGGDSGVRFGGGFRRRGLGKIGIEISGKMANVPLAHQGTLETSSKGKGEQRGGQGDRGHSRTAESVIPTGKNDMSEVMKREMRHSIQFAQIVLKAICRYDMCQVGYMNE